MRLFDIAEASIDVRVVPVAFSGCFGWFHDATSNTGVVICPGVGYDAQVSHATLRRFAADLSQAGFSALRFDYPGTGDSIDVHAADPSNGWLRGVDDALAFLRAAGTQRIVLCGFRVGALLSIVRAAEHPDVDDVILIDPVISGSLFLREIAVAASIGAHQQSPDSTVLEIDGTTMASGQASPLHALAALSLDSRPASRVLILSSSTSRNTDRLASHLDGLGVEVTQAGFGPISENCCNGYVGDPADLISVTRNWLPRATTTNLRMTLRPEHAAGLNDTYYSEQPLRFGGGLFGILCRPQTESWPGRVVVIGNAGAGPRHGHARFHVRLARRLARAGLASFRFDFGGLGDSAAVCSGVGVHIYETDRGSDTAMAVDTLEAYGYHSIVAAGICSGAYHAWRASICDQRIGTLLMVNPALFSWRKGQSLQELMDSSAHSIRFYFANVSRGSVWKRLLSGDLSPRRTLRTIHAHCMRRLAAGFGAVAALLGVSTASNEPLRAMQRLSRRGVRVLVVMAEGDAGLDMLSAYFGRGGRRLARLPGNAVKLLANLDHSVTRRAMQDDVAETLVEFLTSTPDRSQRQASPEPEMFPARPATAHRDVA